MESGGFDNFSLLPGAHSCCYRLICITLRNLNWLGGILHAVIRKTNMLFTPNVKDGVISTFLARIFNLSNIFVIFRTFASQILQACLLTDQADTTSHKENLETVGLWHHVQLWLWNLHSWKRYTPDWKEFNMMLNVTGLILKSISRIEPPEDGFKRQ